MIGGGADNYSCLELVFMRWRIVTILGDEELKISKLLKSMYEKFVGFDLKWKFRMFEFEANDCCLHACHF